MDFRPAIKEINSLLKGEHYSAAAKHCATGIEQALRQALKQNLPKLEQQDQDKVLEALRKRGKKGINDHLMMGDLDYIIHKSTFLDAWARASGNDPSRARWFAIDGFRIFRNELTHEFRNVTKGEAELLLVYLGAILEDFNLLSAEEVRRLGSSDAEDSKRVMQPAKAPEPLRLSNEDFNALVRMIENLAEFGTPYERRLLVKNAFQGKPQADALCSRLRLDGAPGSAASEVVHHLRNFGEIEEGKQALGVFLKYLKEQQRVGTQQAGFIDALFGKYHLETSGIQEPQLGEWREKEFHKKIKEIIIRENTLQHVYVLELALKAAKAVVHLDVLKGEDRRWQAFGTGFMISDDLLLTNHHVIATLREAQETTYSFNHQLGIGDKRLARASVRAKSDGMFFHTNPDLDYTILQLENNSGRKFGYLSFEPVIMRPRERVAIIQHPEGSFKQISIQNNFVAYADERIVQYTTSTQQGSSGSPVLNNEFKVIAVHHSGGELKDPETGEYTLRNEGTSSYAILEDLRQHAPADIYKRIIGIQEC